jgi:hypothetical protein
VSTSVAPTPGLASAEQTTANPAEVEEAFLANVGDVIAEAADLAGLPCDDLNALARANPNMVASIRGFAAALKRVGTSQAVLNSVAVKAALSNLDRVMGQFEGALSLCGINQR